MIRRLLTRQHELTDGRRVQRFWTQSGARAAAVKWNLRCALQGDSTVWYARRVA